jgi:cold shock CspA family protein
LPGVVESVVPADEEPQVDEQDNFSKATVEAFYPRQGFGNIVTDHGEKVLFDLRSVRLVGSKADARYIKEGSKVGYDVGKTSQGTRVCTLKIY